jgi:PKD repeat protein
MYKNSFLLGSIVSIVAFSCSKSGESIACFEPSKSKALVGEEISFSNCSVVTTEGLESKNVWIFGDGKTSTEAAPKHTYATAGIYEVSLTSYGSNGNSTTNAHQKVEIINPNMIFDAFSTGILTQTSPKNIVTSSSFAFFMNKSAIDPTILFIDGAMNLSNFTGGNTKLIKAKVANNTIEPISLPKDTFTFSLGQSNFNGVVKSFKATLNESTKKMTMNYEIFITNNMGWGNTVELGTNKFSFETGE